MSTDALKALAEKAKPTKAEWRPPRPEDFRVEGYYGRTVLAADPSLRKFAAVLLSAIRKQDETLSLVVLAAKKFTTQAHEVGGYEESLRRTLDLAMQIREWIPRAASGYGSLDRIEVVHEGPPIGGGVVARPEASLLGGTALRFAARDLGMTVHKMVMPQSHKRFITDIPKPTKAQHHQALGMVAAHLRVRGMPLITNEDLRDALSLGLLHLTRPQGVQP